MSKKHYTPHYFLAKHTARIRHKRDYLKKQLRKAKARIRSINSTSLFSRYLRPSIRENAQIARRIVRYLVRELSRLANLENQWSGDAAAF